MIFFEIIGVVAVWFVAGFILNVLLYGHLPAHARKETEQGRVLHILLNSATVIFILYLIFS